MEEVKVLLARKTCDDISNLVYNFLEDIDDEAYKTDEYLKYYKDTQKIIDEILCQSGINFEDLDQLRDYICENV
jgi:hypothetical protein